MWVDIATLHPSQDELNGLLYQDIAYPILRLSQRALPGHFQVENLSEMAKLSHPIVRRWCERTPLDDRCGLIMNNQPAKSRFYLSYKRWNIHPWRLAVGYGNTPWGIALIKHLAAFIRHIPNRVRNQPLVIES